MQRVNQMSYVMIDEKIDMMNHADYHDDMRREIMVMSVTHADHH